MNKSKIIIIVLSIIVITVIGFILFSNKSKFDTVDLITKFEESKLITLNKAKMTNKDFGGAPVVTTNAYVFTVQDDMNARIFKVDNSTDLQKLKAYCYIASAKSHSS